MNDKLKIMVSGLPMGAKMKRESFFKVGERVKSLMMKHIEGTMISVNDRGILGFEFFIQWDNGMSGLFTENQIVANGIKKCQR